LSAEAGAPGSAVWETDLGPAAHAFLEGHQFMGADVVPFSAYVEMSLAAAGELYQHRPCGLRELELKEVLPYDRGAARKVRSVAVRLPAGTLSFSVYSLPGAVPAYQDWVLHAKVLVDVGAEPAPGIPSATPSTRPL
jgi:acyl transferase domain-containing protein